MTGGYWEWKEDADGYAPYKNEVLKKWQDALRERGIISKNDLLVFTAQALAENGALDPLVIGDKGCSLGLPQKNWCSHEGISAKKALKKYPEWSNLDTQLGWFADSTIDHLKKFSDIKWAVIAHNSPKAALYKNDDHYWKAVVRQQKLLEWKDS